MHLQIGFTLWYFMLEYNIQYRQYDTYTTYKHNAQNKHEVHNSTLNMAQLKTKLITMQLNTKEYILLAQLKLYQLMILHSCVHAIYKHNHLACYLHAYHVSNIMLSHSQYASR